jgi:hypothetical protein
MGGDEFQKAVKKIGEYLKRFAGKPASFSDQSNPDMQISTTKVTYGNIETQVFIIQPKAQTSPDVIFSVGVFPLPKENLLPLYRQLLVWNYFQTDIAHFAISDEQNAVFLVLRRPFEGFDYQEFRYSVEKTSSVALNTILMLTKQFGIKS